LISDLHNHIYGNNQEKLISKITKQKPDVILLAGDIADDAVPIEGTKLLLSGIKDIAPCFMFPEITNTGRGYRKY
jgi:predicted MPP superfamily phosphohydrolase